MIATWGGNNNTIDVLVKSNAISNVTRVFKREDISFDIVIEDLQKRINEENPPLDENELELQDRRGMLKVKQVLTLGSFSYNIPRIAYHFVAARAYNFWRYRDSRRRIGYIGALMGYNSLDIPMEYWSHANWGSLLIFGTESVCCTQEFNIFKFLV